MNDSLIHFCCALERSLINTGIVQRKIEELKKLTESKEEKSSETSSEVDNQDSDGSHDRDE